MRLSEYAKEMGITYQTAYAWFRDGKIDGAYQVDSGTIIIPNKNEINNQRTKTIIYARVSSSEQRKTNLQSQAERMEQFCIANGWIVDKVIKEVGSGLNDSRKQLLSVLKDPTVKRIVVEHRDRLTRFGFNYLKTMGDLMGFEIIVANNTLDNDNNDLMADFTSIITSFCARLYSKRRGQNKITKIKDDLK